MDYLQTEIRRQGVIVLLVLAIFLLETRGARAQNDTAGEPIRSGSPLDGNFGNVPSAPSNQSYTHIDSTDNPDPNAFWYTYRPNILNQDVPENWDAMKLINTDRPDFTDVATTVGRGVTQLESGWTYLYRNIATDHFRQNTLPEFNLRIGTTDNFEWRVRWTGVAWTAESPIPSVQTATLSGATDPTIGFKWAVTKQENWRPMNTIVTQLYLPAGNDNFSAKKVQFGLNWVYNWQIRKWLFARGSTGVDFLTVPGTNFTDSPIPFYLVQRDEVTLGHQSISAYWQLSQRIGFFTEWYMLFRHGNGLTDNRPDHFHDYGLYYYITPNLQLDARVGQELSRRVNEFFTGAGISTRW